MNLILVPFGNFIFQSGTNFNWIRNLSICDTFNWI